MTMNEKIPGSKLNRSQSSPVNGKKHQPTMGGMTNGLGGRTNGMTNGMGGRTNGMTNGLGGRTNGMTNGLGGRTNGMTNGLGSGGPVMRSRRMDDSAISPFRISLIIVIAFMVIVPASFFMLAQNDPAYKGVRVDGVFEDWEEVAKFVDPQQYSIAALDIVNYAVTTNTAGTLFLYADTRDSLMSISYVDSLLVFIDADDNSATGYSVRGMGADYVAEVHGWDGEIKGKQMGVFSGSDQSNWSAWNWRGINAAISLKQIEIGIPGSTISLKAAHSFLFMTKRGDSVAEICDARIALEKSALVVRQIPGSLNGVIASDGVMSLELSACGPAVDVTAIDFSYSGVTAPTVSGLPATIPAGGTITLAVTAPVTGLANGTFVDIAVSLVTGTGLSTIIGQRMTAYANVPPGSITIDGAFGDWNGITKFNDIDAAANPDIDIAQYAGVKSVSQAFFYLKVSDGGEMLGGSIVPLARTIPGEPGEPGTPVPPAPLQRVSGEDMTRIYIDTKSGGQIINGISADYLIEVKGLEGRITSRMLYSLPGKTFIMNIGAANLGRELEVGVALDQIGYNGTMAYFIESTDWLDRADRTDVKISSPMPFSTRNSGALERPYILTPHAPIRINSDADFTEANGVVNWATGAGTIANPWIISNWDINGAGFGYCIYIGNTTNYVVVMKSYLHDAGGVANVPYYADAGLIEYKVSNSYITNNTVSGNTMGILLSDSGGNAVTNNTVSTNDNGIVLTSSNGNIVFNNTANNNDYGISLDTCTDTVIVDNEIVTNAQGILILDSTGISVYHNNFLGNTIQAEDNNANVWDNGYPSGGNYWSDWTGPDANFDGIVDTPYPNIVGGAAVDNYPFMGPDYWNKPVRNVNTGIRYYTIQGAIDDATSGHTILVSAGTFPGGILLNKTVNLVGSGMLDTTIIDAQTGIGISVTADGATISDFKIFNGSCGINVEFADDVSISSVNSSVNTEGIYVFRSNRVEIHDCIFSSNTFTGLRTSSSNNSKISNITSYNNDNAICLDTSSSSILDNSTISNNVIGISLLSSIGNTVSNNTATFNTFGIYVSSSSSNTLNNNTASSNFFSGIYLDSSSDNNNLSNNNASLNDNGAGTGTGIYLSASNHNTLTKNSLYLNAYCGLYITASESNNIFRNKFIINVIQAYDDTGSNFWNLGYPTGGNYWSDYIGVDVMSGPLQNISGHDHIGDTPYDSGAGAVDQYPLYTIPEFQTILLPVLLIMGLVLVAKHGKKEEDDSVTCPSCNTLVPADETECPVCGEPLMPDDVLGGELEGPADEESWDELADLTKTPNDADLIEAHREATAHPAKAAEVDADEKAKPEIKHTALFGGLALSAVGAFGVVGLRAGLVQPILGYDNPSPGIGSMELMGLIASALPLAFGLVIILIWGIRNDPVYYEIEKSQKTDEDLGPSEPNETEPIKIEEPKPIKVTPTVKEIPQARKAEEPAISIKKTPEPTPAAKKASEPVLEIKKTPEPVKKVPEPAPVAMKKPEPIPVAKTPEPARTPAKVSEPVPAVKKSPEPAAKKAPEPAPTVKKAPETAPAAPISDLDKIRIERCNKMLSFAAFLPEDGDRLRALIAAGTPVQKFTEEVKKSVEKRKKIDSEAAEKKKAAEAARRKKEEDEALLKEIDQPKDAGFLDDEDLEDLLLTELDK
jgi:parallel beta-helix repeat protein